MPLAAILGAAGAAINAFSTSANNDANIEYQKWLYERQKTDNLAFWDKQNAYNTPQAQMQRFTQAGLNPNLIYGQGNGGNAAPVSTPNAGDVKLQPPQWGNVVGGGLDALSQIYDLEIKGATADNLKAQAGVIEQETLLKAAQVDQVIAGAERSQFDLGLERDLRDTSLEARRESLRKTSAETNTLLGRYGLEQISNDANVAEVWQRIVKSKEEVLTMRLGRAKTKEEIDNIKADRNRLLESTKLLSQQGILNDLDIALKKKGIMPSDPMYARFLARAFDSLSKMLNYSPRTR